MEGLALPGQIKRSTLQEKLSERGYNVWLEECYQHKPHSALGNNTKVSPENAYRSDHKVLNFLDPDRITNAFLHCEARKVDKAGCISFDGHKYEVGITFVGRAVFEGSKLS